MTGGTSATFVATQHPPDVAATALTREGFVLEPTRAVVRSLLDTFDGRLHAAGLRLECRVGSSSELLLSGDDTSTARLVVAVVPRMVDELPPGPFRTRLTAITVDRALLPVVRVRARCTPAVRRDADGKVVATAAIWETTVVGDRDELTTMPWTVEVDEVRGFAKHARKTRAALGQIGLHELGHDTLAEAARVSGAHVGAYPDPSDIALEPDMPAADGYRSVLCGLADTIAANWQGTIDQTDIEFLHDLRIAVRRTRTVLGESKKVLPSIALDEARAAFARLGAATGPPRDLDVYLVEWATYTKGLAPETALALEPVRALLRERQVLAHAELADALREPATCTCLLEWQSWLAGSTAGDDEAPNAGEQLIDVVAQRIVRAHTRLVDAGRLIRPDTPADDVHDLRKDAKKLRYLIECFASVLSERPRKRFVRRLKVLQDNLGVHQDAEVHVAMLREIASDLHDRGEQPETTLAIGQLAERIDQRRLAARAEFAERFATYDTDATRRDLARALGRDER